MERKTISKPSKACSCSSGDKQFLKRKMLKPGGGLEGARRVGGMLGQLGKDLAVV